MLRQAMKSWARSPTLTWCQGRLLGGTALCPSPSSAPALHEGFSLTQLSSAEHSTSPLGETCLWLYWFDLGKWALWKILLSVRFLFPPMNWAHTHADTFLTLLTLCRGAPLKAAFWFACRHSHIIKYNKLYHFCSKAGNLHFFTKSKWNSVCLGWAGGRWGWIWIHF